MNISYTPESFPVATDNHCRIGPHDRIVLTGAAGLVGQNLVVQLLAQGYRNLLAIDKHEYNLGMLKTLHSEVEILHADLAEPGPWQNCLAETSCLVQLQAQITGKETALFVRNNIHATRLVLEATRRHKIPYVVHISSSVVNSVAKDDYTNTKTDQEQLVIDSGLHHCVLRPTLMFGWFDPKHLGWLSRFMQQVPVFPIPGHGRYMRQPLYIRDFCRVIIRCMETQPSNAVFDIIGHEQVDYVDIIRAIRELKQLRTPIVHIPYPIFYGLLKLYAVFSRNPPFTADQLKALTAGDEFAGVDMERDFAITPTPFLEAIRETFTDTHYADVVLKR